MPAFSSIVFIKCWCCNHQYKHKVFDLADTVIFCIDCMGILNRIKDEYAQQETLLKGLMR